jgi:hypothetical protein
MVPRPAARLGSALVLWLAMASTVSGCGEPGQPPGWSLSPGAANVPPVPYDSAPPWADGVNCAGGLAPGASDLGDALQQRFPQIVRVYGYDCRPNTANVTELSQHGTGRAVDLAIPTIDGGADNERGDAVATWLVEHSGDIGVQLIIWDRGVWLGSDPGSVKPYGGPDPHVDHLHVELTVPGSLRQTPFFLAPAGTAPASPT